MFNMSYNPPAANPLGNNPTIGQALNETAIAAANAPKGIADALNLGAQISAWSNRPENLDTFDQPQFKNAANMLFGPGQDQIGSMSGKYKDALLFRLLLNAMS